MSAEWGQRLHQLRTTWHITFDTYGSRLHGGQRPTVDPSHNKLGEPFVERDPLREEMEKQAMRSRAIYLSREQQLFAQNALPAIFERGGWDARVWSAGDDHVHALLDVDRSIHGEQVRRLLKRWLGQALDSRYGKPASGTWWAEQGSNIAIDEERYLNNAYGYIFRQRA